MTEDKQSRLIPQNPHWYQDLPERDAPGNTRAEIYGDVNNIDGDFLEISRSSSKMRGLMIFYGTFALLTTLIVLFVFTPLLKLFDEINWFTFFFPLALVGLVSMGIHGIRLDTATPRDEPVRFNRKRGKVYVTEFKHTWNPFGKWQAIANEYAWNCVQAEITKQTGFSGKVYMVRYALVLVILKPGTNEVVDRFPLKSNSVTTTDLEEMWGYCRRYMASGPEAVTKPGRIRRQEVSLRNSIFSYFDFLEPGERGSDLRRRMHFLEWFVAVIIIPAYPIFFIIAICHYIAMRLAPDAVWPPEMDAESKSATS